MHTNEQKKHHHPTPPPQMLAQQRQSAHVQPGALDLNPGFANLNIIPPEAQSETTVEVVTETNFSNGKTTAEGTTTRSATEPVSDSVSVTATESTSGEARTNSASLKVKEKASGISATAGIKAVDPADPQQATAAKGFVKVGGEWTPFPFLQVGVNNSLEFSSLKKAKYSLDGSIVIFPNGTLKPELAAKFLYDDKGPSAGVDLGLNWDITKALSAKAGVKLTLDPKGNLETSGGLGIAFKFK